MSTGFFLPSLASNYKVHQILDVFLKKSKSGAEKFLKFEDFNFVILKVFKKSAHDGNDQLLSLVEHLKKSCYAI